MKNRRILVIILIGSLCFASLFIGCDMLGMEDLEGQIFYDNDQGDTITASGYAGGAGPFIVPDDFEKCQGVNVEISATNDSGHPVLLALNLSASQTDEYEIRITLQDGERGCQ